jgi:hypothetical protein
MAFLRRRLGQALFAASALLALGACLHTRGPSIPLAAAAPDFTLQSHEGKEVSLSGLLKTGPAVLVFYRGYW